MFIPALDFMSHDEMQLLNDTYLTNPRHNFENLRIFVIIIRNTPRSKVPETTGGAFLSELNRLHPLSTREELASRSI